MLYCRPSAQRGGVHRANRKWWRDRSFNLVFRPRLIEIKAGSGRLS